MGPGKAGSAHFPGLRRRPRLPVADAPAAGKDRPPVAEGNSLLPFWSRRSASGCHRGPSATVARPTSTQPPPGSPARDPELTFPGGSALLAHSPQPRVGAARRSVPVAGAGPGAWEPLTATSQHSPQSCRRRLPPWLRRRHLTTEVTHRPSAPPPAPSPESGVGAPSSGWAEAFRQEAQISSPIGSGWSLGRNL